MPHANACLTPRGRLVLVTRIADGWPVSRAARAAGISRQTGSKWWNRYGREGSAGLVDRRMSEFVLVTSAVFRPPFTGLIPSLQWSLTSQPLPRTASQSRGEPFIGALA